MRKNKCAICGDFISVKKYRAHKKNHRKIEESNEKLQKKSNRVSKSIQRAEQKEDSQPSYTLLYDSTLPLSDEIASLTKKPDESTRNIESRDREIPTSEDIKKTLEYLKDQSQRIIKKNPTSEKNKDRLLPESTIEPFPLPILESTSSKEVLKKTTNRIQMSSLSQGPSEETRNLSDKIQKENDQFVFINTEIIGNIQENNKITEAFYETKPLTIERSEFIVEKDKDLNTNAGTDGAFSANLSEFENYEYYLTVHRGETDAVKSKKKWWKFWR